MRSNKRAEAFAHKDKVTNGVAFESNGRGIRGDSRVHRQTRTCVGFPAMFRRGDYCASAVEVLSTNLDKSILDRCRDLLKRYARS